MLNIVAKCRVLILCTFFIPISINANYVLINDNIITQKVAQKIESLGSELHQKADVNVYISLPKSLGKKTVVEYGNELAKKLEKPYVLLTLAKFEEKVDIVFSKELKGSFDRDAVLSPFPWSGTIIPILAVKKENDKYNAAALNGYADIVEQIAASRNIILDGAIGNTNRNIYHYLKIGIYGFLLILLIRYFYRKVSTRND